MNKIILYRAFTYESNYRYGMIMKVPSIQYLSSITDSLERLGFRVLAKGAVISYDVPQVVEYMVENHREHITGIMLVDSIFKEYTGFKAKLATATKSTFLDPPPPGSGNYVVFDNELSIMTSHWRLTERTGIDSKCISEYVIQLSDSEFCSMVLALPSNYSLIKIIPKDLSVKLSDFISIPAFSDTSIFSVSTK